MWRNYLENNNIRTVYYNAWENDDSDSAILPLLYRIISLIKDVENENFIDYAKKFLKTLCLTALGIFICSTITMAEEITTSAVIPETSTTVISTTDTTVASTTNTPTDTTIVKKKPKIKSTIKKISLNKTVLRLNKKDSRSLKALYTDKKKRRHNHGLAKNPSIAKVNKKRRCYRKEKGHYICLLYV